MVCRVEQGGAGRCAGWSAVYLHPEWSEDGGLQDEGEGRGGGALGGGGGGRGAARLHQGGGGEGGEGGGVGEGGGGARHAELRLLGLGGQGQGVVPQVPGQGGCRVLQGVSFTSVMKG